MQFLIFSGTYKRNLITKVLVFYLSRTSCIHLGLSESCTDDKAIMIPNRQWMQSVPRERPLFGDAFRRANYYPNPVTTIVAVVNVFCATGTFTKSALGLVATPASYFFVYVFPSLKGKNSSIFIRLLIVNLVQNNLTGHTESFLVVVICIDLDVCKNKKKLRGCRSFTFRKELNNISKICCEGFETIHFKSST